MNLELQQRAVEYNLVIKKYDNLRDGLFEQMPPLEMRANINIPNGMNDQNDEYDDQTEPHNEESLMANDTIGDSAAIKAANKEKLVKEKQKEDATKTLLDLFGDETTSTSTIPNSTTTPSNNDLFDLMSDMNSSPVQTANSKIDIIKQINQNQTKTKQQPASNSLDIFSLGNNTTTAKNGNGTDIFDLLGNTNHNHNHNLDNKKAQPINNGLNDLFGGLNVTTNNTNKSDDIMNMFNTRSTNPSNPSSDKSMVVYEKNDIKIIFEPAAMGAHSSSEQHFIQMTAQNTSRINSCSEFLFSAAVPKTMQMQLSTPEQSIIQPLKSLIQTIAISNPKKERLRLRVKVSYKLDDRPLQDQFDVSDLSEKMFN
jgi:hypothetical protein